MDGASEGATNGAFVGGVFRELMGFLGTRSCIEIIKMSFWSQTSYILMVRVKFLMSFNFKNQLEVGVTMSAMGTR